MTFWLINVVALFQNPYIFWSLPFVIAILVELLRNGDRQVQK